MPTPTQPTLGVVKDPAFASLEELLRPQFVYKRPLFGIALTSFAAGSKSADRAKVRVLDEQQLGGYNVVVLEADSAAALNDWLGKNGYVSRPALVKWLEPYIARQWKITAFKFVGDPKNGGSIDTSAMRMSFTTDRPFYPYREPEDAGALAAVEGRDWAGGRLLRVHFLADKRVSGTIGDGGEWPGTVKWAGALPEAQQAKLNEELGLKDGLREGLWLTTFEDHSSPRPGTDEVWFASSADQSEVMPEPIVVRLEQPIIPLDLVILFVLVLIGLVWIIRRLLRPGPSQAPAV